MRRRATCQRGTGEQPARDQRSRIGLRCVASRNTRHRCVPSAPCRQLGQVVRDLLHAADRLATMVAASEVVRLAAASRPRARRAQPSGQCRRPVRTTRCSAAVGTSSRNRRRQRHVQLTSRGAGTPRSRPSDPVPPGLGSRWTLACHPRAANATTAWCREMPQLSRRSRLSGSTLCRCLSGSAYRCRLCVPTRQRQGCEL